MSFESSTALEFKFFNAEMDDARELMLKMKRSLQLFDGDNNYVETCVCIARLSEAESVYRSSQAEASCSEVFFILQLHACATNHSSHGTHV